MTEVSRRPMSGLFGRARAQPENPFESGEEGPTTSSKMQNGSKAKGRSHSSGGGSSKNPFDDEEGFSHSKPPRYNSVGGEDDDDTPPKGRGANKENSRRGAAATSSQSDDLFGYNSSRAKSGFGNGQFDDNGSPDEEYVNQAVQDLEKHAVKKSQETTVSVKNCLRVAEDTMGIGVQTLVTLHEQGVQIERTHERAVDLDQHLSKGEKLLGSLGGIFSKGWKPKKTKKITGPMVGRADKHQKESAEDREALGLDGGSATKKTARTQDTSTFHGQLEAEKETQDDMLDDLSNVVSQMKEMSMDMNTEIDRQSPAIDHLHDDIQELNSRVHRANLRGQKLLRR